MDDRQKTIEEVKHLQGVTTLRYLNNPEERLKFHKTMDSVLKLLKEQQPRVLGYEELFKKETFCVWYEEWGDPTIRQVACIDGEYEDMNVHYAIEDINENRTEYGIVWRMWTGEPTEEQRKAVPWD